MTKKIKPKGGDMSLVPSASAPSASPFKARSEVVTPAGVIVKSMSPMLKPAAWPVIDGKNAVLVGVFTKTFNTAEFSEGTGKDKKTKVGTGIEVVPEGAPVGVALPVTATLRTGLEITGDGAEAKSPHLGCVVEIELLPERIKSKKGQAAWHFVVAIHPKK